MSTLLPDAQRQAQGPSTWRGVIIGLIPLLLLMLIILVTLLATELMRQWVTIATSGFFVQQQVALIILIAGFVLALLVFAFATWRVVKRIAIWQQSGLLKPARAALWMLGITTLIIILPVLLAIALPQHPAP